MSMAIQPILEPAELAFLLQLWPEEVELSSPDLFPEPCLLPASASQEDSVTLESEDLSALSLSCPEAT